MKQAFALCLLVASSPDRRVLTSTMRDESGAWVEYMRADIRR